MATLEQQFRSYAAAHPSRDGGTWNQWCGSLMFRMCDSYGHAPTGDVSSAWTVWKRTPTAGTNPADAPQGAFHFWDIGGPSNGHVGVDLRGGGTHVGMATSALAERLGDSIGINSVSGYTNAKGAKYVGWCLTYADGDVTGFDPVGGGGTAGDAVNYAYGLTNEAVAVWQQALKNLGLLPADYKVDGIAGPIFVGGDPKPGGMQQYLKNRGFLQPGYEVDGKPGPLYGYALQDLAIADGGYTADRDGAPGQLTSAALVVAGRKIIAPQPEPEPEPVDPWATLPTLPDGWMFVCDVGTTQKDFDFAAFAAAGGKGVIIKFGGANASDSPYESPHYRAQLARARAAGLLIGHYFFNGAENGLTPETCADFVVEHVDLREGELLCLDVENEVRNGVIVTKMWTPDECRRFNRRVQNTFRGIQIPHYMSRSVTALDWAPVIGDGHPLWVAMYDDNDGTIPAERPGTGGWAEWLLWQYTSARTVPGSSVDVDCNVALKDAWARFGYVAQPVDPDPEPEPEPTDTRPQLHDYFAEAATLAEKYAEVFAT